MLYHGEISACWEIKKKHQHPNPVCLEFLKKKKKKIEKKNSNNLWKGYFWLISLRERNESLSHEKLQNFSWFILPDFRIPPDILPDQKL